MDVVELAQQMVALDSVTAHDNTSISHFQKRLLEQLGFEVEWLAYRDGHGTDKVCLAARRLPTTPHSETCNSALAAPVATRGIGFFAHNDVVSVEGWNCAHGGPFSAALAEERLWGRGACDMKGPTAAALAALARIDRNQQTAPLYFFITGDEECGMSGARLLAERSTAFAELVAGRATGIIGEPTSLRVVNAHKGGCHLEVVAHGVAAHSSTSEGLNANWQVIPFLNRLAELRRDCEEQARYRNEDFSPPTLSLNFVIENRPCSTNITVGKSSCRIFFRPMPNTAWRELLAELIEAAQACGLQVTRPLQLPPLCTPASSEFVQTALILVQQTAPQAVSYATDGCCFDQVPELIVIGPGNIEQAHRADEWIDLEQLVRGVEVYQQLFEHYATAKGISN